MTTYSHSTSDPGAHYLLTSLPHNSTSLSTRCLSLLATRVLRPSLLSNQPRPPHLVLSDAFPLLKRDPANVRAIAKPTDPIDPFDDQPRPPTLMDFVAWRPRPRIIVSSEETLSQPLACRVRGRDGLDVALKAEAGQVGGTITIWVFTVGAVMVGRLPAQGQRDVAAG